MYDDVAAVVIGRNEGKRLASCLQSLPRKLSMVVYVDFGSSDSSIVIAKEAGAHVIELQTGPYSAARARNAGFEAVRERCPDVALLQFVDGDCTVASGWLSEAIVYLRAHPDVAVICGRRRELNPAGSIYNRLCDIEWDTPVGEAAACGGDSVVRVSALSSVGGFCSQLIAGEEPELCLRLREKGWKIWRLDAEMTLHDAAMLHFRQWWKRAIRFGYGAAQVATLHWRSRFVPWKRDLLRSFIWGFLIPLGICGLGFAYPVVFIAILIYPLQITRIAISRGGTALDWQYAALITIAKFAQFYGLAKFVWRRLRRLPSELIEYRFA